MRCFFNDFILISFITLFACNTGLKQNDWDLKVIDEITFETDSLVPINPSTIALLETDSVSQLFFYNYFDSKYQFYAYPSGELVQEVPLYLDGPNSVKPFSGGVLTAKDSIWLVNNMPPGIVLLDFKGEVKLKRSIQNKRFPITYLGVSNQNPLFQIGNKLYGPQPLFMKHHDMDKEDIQQQQLIYSYDFEKDTVEWYDVFYKENYWDQGKKISGYSWARRKDKIYIAPLHDHEIQVFDTQTGSTTYRKEVRSENVNKFHIVN
ncbi:protein of unknown function [Cyclobacterium lianum]|uniref:TolB-like 6-blade propeller-like n=1 Tax=Cyclobacterium lianum TaxID=388280 RepID=A0A1M7NJS9_9BACT|nr:protein of unknown function [Cyclobacterium lianum]